MKKIFLILVTAVSLNALAQQKWNYPPTPKIPVYDTIWGKVIQDDYRWMEQANNPMFEDWLKSQQAFTDSIMNTIPNQDVFAAEVKSLITKIGVMTSGHTSVGRKYAWISFDARTDKLPKVYYNKGDGGNDEMIFDALTFRPGKMLQIKDIEFSPTGSWLRVSTSQRGEDHETHYFYNTKTKSFSPDSTLSMNMSAKFYRINDVDYIIYTGLNTQDVKSYEYKKNLKLYAHKVGSLENDFLLLDGEKNPNLQIESSEILRTIRPDESDYIFIEPTAMSTKSRLLLLRKKDFKPGNMVIKPFAERDKNIISCLSHGNKLYYIVSTTGGKREVRSLDINSPDFNKSKFIFSPEKGWNLNAIDRSKNFLLIQVSKNGLQSRNYTYNFKTGKLEEVVIPLNGMIYITPLSVSTDETEVSTRSWTEPLSSYSYKLDSKKFEKGRFYTDLGFENLDNLVVEEVEVPSHDGEMVPLSIQYDKRYVKKDGNNIVLLSGYGSYGVVNTPEFQGFMQDFFKRGVIFATAHVRGGGAKGATWHNAGRMQTKPNTWKDAIACAEWLINEKYGSKGKMVIDGHSAGGIMAGMAMIERPDLFKVVNPQVGMLNALRSEFTPNGPINIPEFGSQQTEEGFKALYAMDAFGHIKTSEAYPAQFITAGYNDPRVIVWMPAKFTAKMQASNSSSNPVLLQTNFSGGHGGAASFDEQIKLIAQQFAFIFWQTGHPEFQPKK